MPSDINLPSPELAEMQTGIQADPAILMVGSGPVPQDYSNADSASGVMSSLLGDSKLGFGGFDAVPAATPQAKQFLSSFEMSSNDVAPSLESICQSGGGAACGLSSEPLSLPLPVPGSLSNALPASGGTALPGFCAGSDSSALETPAQQLAGGLQQLQMGGDLPQVRPAGSTAEVSSLPSSLTGMLQPAGLTAQQAAHGSNLAPTMPVQGLASEGLGSMPPSSLASIQPVLSAHEPPRSNTGRGRSAQMANAAPPGVPGGPPPPPPPGAVGLGLEPIGCPTPCSAVENSLSQPPMPPLMHPPIPQMGYDGVPQMGPPMGAPPPWVRSPADGRVKPSS